MPNPHFSIRRQGLITGDVSEFSAPGWEKRFLFTGGNPTTPDLPNTSTEDRYRAAPKYATSTTKQQ